MKDRAKLSTRPESARTQDTKLTLQSESSLSNFSETDAFAVRKRTQHPTEDFGQHVEQLDRQKRFKHLAGLAVIPQKKESEELKNQTCKPFEGRRSSNMKKSDKVENGRTEKPVAATRSSKQELLQQASASSGNGTSGQQKSNKFLEKSIHKMNGLVVGSGKQSKTEQPKSLLLNISSQDQEIQQQQVRLNFAAFVANDPVKRRQEEALKVIQDRKSPQKVTASKPKVEADPATQKLEAMMRQANERRVQNAQLSQYVNERQLRNMDSFPSGYEAAIESMSNRQITEHNFDELDKLDVSNYDAGLFGDRDIATAIKNIRELDQRIDKAESNQVEATKQEDDLEYSRDSEHPSLTASSLSHLKRNNNLFLTEILKNGGNQQDIQLLIEMEKSHMKLTKLEQQDDSETSSDENESSRPARSNNLIFERNRIQAGGALFQQCEYLSEEHKRRLEVLMADIQAGRQETITPFDLTEQEREHLRRLEQGLNVYQTMFGTSPNTEPIIYEQNLPKDPVLRRKSELKILKDKISSVNSGLRNVSNIPVDRFKIRSLLERLQDIGVSQPPSTIIRETRREFEEVSRRVEESEQFLQASQEGRIQILSSLEEIRGRFISLEAELHQLNQLSDEEIKQLELRELEQRRSRLVHYEQVENNLQEGLRSLEEYSSSLRCRLRQLDALESDEVELPSIDLSALHLNETAEELDARLGALASAHHP